MGDIVGHLLQAAHQRFDALEHGVDVVGEAVEFVAGAGNRQPAGKIAGHDGLRRSGHGIDAVEHPPADEETAGKAKHDDQRERPASGIGNDAVEALALLEVAADQETKPAGSCTTSTNAR